MFCWGARRFVSGPGALCVRPRRSVCRALALCVSGPGALCVRPRRSMYRAPALCVSGPGVLCVEPRRSVSNYASVYVNLLCVFMPTHLGPSNSNCAFQQRHKAFYRICGQRLHICSCQIQLRTSGISDNAKTSVCAKLSCLALVAFVLLG